MHRFSAKVFCTDLGMTNGGGEVDCSYGKHSFRLSPTLVRIKN